MHDQWSKIVLMSSQLANKPHEIILICSHLLTWFMRWNAHTDRGDADSLLQSKDYWCWQGNEDWQEAVKDEEWHHEQNPMTGDWVANIKRKTTKDL